MNVLRFLGRALLGSYFIGHGVSTLRASQAAIEEAEPAVEAVGRLADRFLPESVRGLLPTDAKTWVRLHGAAEIAGGLLMASGMGRRLGASLLIKAQLFRVAAGNPPNATGRGPISPELGRDLALLGACLIETLDTQGKPSVAWRLRQGRPPAGGVGSSQKAARCAPCAARRSKAERRGAAKRLQRPQVHQRAAENLA